MACAFGKSDLEMKKVVDIYHTLEKCDQIKIHRLVIVGFIFLCVCVFVCRHLCVMM